MADLPRVTHVLEAVGLAPDLAHVNPATLESARARGTEVHRLIESLVYGYYDEAEVAPEHAGYLDAWSKFVAEAKFEPVKAEFEVTHRAWNFVGHPDVLGILDGRRCILDCKTGTAEGGEYQVAAYVLAYNDEHPTERVEIGAVLELRADSTYRFTEVDLKAATQVWLAALVVFRAQKGRP